MTYKILGEIITVKGGKRLPKGSNLQSEINSHPYIRVRDMGSRYIPRTGLEYVPNEVFPKISRYIVNTNDIIISIVGTIGLVSVIDEYFDNASLSENCAKLTSLDRIDALYLYYFLISEKGQSEIKMSTVGAVQAKLPLYNIEKVNIYWPERNNREAIVKQLSEVDNKVELNTQTNQTLEQIAQALFKSWFVDFDPVKAKIAALESGGSASDAELAAMSVIAAKSPEQLAELKQNHPEAYEQLAHTASLFPAAMQESELGEVPDGWQPKAIKDILQLNYGKALKKDDRVDGFVAVYGSGGVIGAHSVSLVSGPGIIVGRKGTVGSIYYEFDDFYPIDTVFYVSPVEGYLLTYIHQLLQTLGLDTMNTDAAVPGLNRNNVYRLLVCAPCLSLITVFSRHIDSLYKKINLNNKENRSIESLKDMLLPKLLSGEIKVSNLEVVLEDA